MSLNFSKKTAAYLVGLPAWVFASFFLAQILLRVVLEIMLAAGVSFDSFSEPVFNTVVGAVVYALAIFIVIWVPWRFKKFATTKNDLGIQRWPSWLDIVWAPAGLIVYFILTALMAAFAMAFLPFVDYNQAQETGFGNVSTQFEYALAFITLVIVAPVAEELLFRGYLFGKLRKHAPLWASILITSVLFGLVHMQWNVGLDVFVLSIVLCLLRVMSGSIWPAILLHMLKNGIAYYFLFVNPTALSTLGG